MQTPFRRECKLVLLVHFPFVPPSFEVLSNREVPHVIKYKRCEGQCLGYQCIGVAATCFESFL